MDRLTCAYEKALLSKDNYALVNVNIKKYRYFRYAYGEKAGREILRQFFEILKSCIADDDVCIQREQDDFAIIMKYEEKDLIDRIWLPMVVDQLFEIEHPVAHHNLYASFGVYCIEDKNCPFEEAWDKVQFCRLNSKSMPTRVYCYEFYDDDMLHTYLDSCRLEEMTAKAKEQHLYEIYIQPKVDIHTGKIIGGETLLRLFLDGKMIPVSDFLPILNKNGYIRQIDQYHYEKVIQRMEERFRLGKRNEPISFNISNSYFFDELLIKDYCEILDRYDVDPNYLELEFMESILMDEEQLMRHIEAFHEKGFSCALDDFGNGYSNFKLLSTSNVDTVKIDRVFFQDLSNEKNKEILKTILQLLLQLHVHIVAEGVEKLEDVEFLMEAGCDAVQGFYFYKPMPMEDFFALLDEGK